MPDIASAQLGELPLKLPSQLYETHFIFRRFGSLEFSEIHLHHQATATQKVCGDADMPLRLFGARNLKELSETDK